MTWKDGRKYEGNYKLGKEHGKGKMQWPDGLIYDGEWFEGKQHGNGSFIKDGNLSSGKWEYGVNV